MPGGGGGVSTAQFVHNRKFWTEFIQLYENLPALWDSRNSLYKDRIIKMAAYDLMVNKLREFEPNATREDVLRKINIFRTNYRRECARIKISEMSGREYKTTLWYFPLISFLQFLDMPPKSRKINNNEEKTILGKKQKILKRNYRWWSNEGNTYRPSAKKSIINQQTTSDELTNSHLEYTIYNGDCENLNGNINENETSNVYYHNDDDVNTDDGNDDDRSLITKNNQDNCNEEELQMPYRLQKHKLIQPSDDTDMLENLMMEDVTESSNDCSNYENAKYNNLTNNERINLLQMTQNSKEMPHSDNKSYDAFQPSAAAQILAKSWALQYDEMPDDQKLFARKAIGDILFEGCLGNLRPVCSTKSEAENDAVSSNFVME